jgi:hypothetical protein
MDFIFNIKQIGLITENSERTEKLIKSLHKKGYSFQHIKNMTGLPKEVVLSSLFDEEITTKDNTSEIWEMLYNHLWNTKLIKKEKTYNDGSSVHLDLDSFSSTINFNYKTKNGNKIYGYATLFWDAEPRFPVDGQEFAFKDEKFLYYEMYIDSYNMIEKYIPKKLTIRDIVKLFNQGYFKVLKNVLDKMEIQYIDELSDNL